MLNFISRWTLRIMNNIFLLVITFLVILPLLWMICTSFSGDAVSTTDLLAHKWSLNGYRQVLAQTPFVTWACNSFLVAFIQTLGQLIVAFFAAYAFARFDFPGKNALFFFVIATMIIPVQALMIPTFVTINNLGWINTYQGVIIPFLASGYAIFLLRQFFLKVPKEMIDAALVDGCGELRVLRYVFLPISVPAVTALAIILFVNHWNEYYWPLMVLLDEGKMTLPIALVKFRNDGLIEWIPTMAAATLSMLPVLFLYIMTQKSFLEGFSNSGIKG